MRCRPSLRLRLWLGAALLAALALIAAGVAVLGLTRTQGLAAEAMAAQRRAEAYGTYSAQVNDWMLTRLRGQGADSRRVLAALDGLDGLVAADVHAAGSAEEATIRARQGVAVARLRALFGQLSRALDGPAAEPAMAFYAAQAPLIISQQAEQEIRRRDAALTAMEALRRPLHAAAVAVALLAPLVLAALYFLVLRPLFARLSLAGATAGGHDELGLMFARLRRRSGQVDRRQARLEATVAERTAALSDANRRLERVDAMRRRFFADVGHELRTPLTVILGEAELGAAHADPETRRAFDTIRARAMRLFRRIEDLLRIARSESGQLELSKGPVALDQVVALALADLSPLLKRAGVRVEIGIPPITVAADAEWLRQVFAGMFENAAKYAGKGATVHVTAVTEGNMARVLIADDGPGLSEDIRATALDRFARAGGGAGFGVGLALAAWVMEASGGRLTVLPGPGMRLMLELPLWEEG